MRPEEQVESGEGRRPGAKFETGRVRCMGETHTLVRGRSGKIGFPHHTRDEIRLLAAVGEAGCASVPKALAAGALHGVKVDGTVKRWVVLAADTRAERRLLRRMQAEDKLQRRMFYFALSLYAIGAAVAIAAVLLAGTLARLHLGWAPAWPLAAAAIVLAAIVGSG